MIINGQERDIEAGISVHQLLNKLELQAGRVVVELNFEIVEKSLYKETILNKEDQIEIISFMGGG
jgi:sulfur carrier protein